MKIMQLIRISYIPNKGLNWYSLKAGFNFSNIKRVMIIGDETADKFSSIIVVVDKTSVYATPTDSINFNDINTSEWFNLGTVVYQTLMALILLCN